MPQNPRPSLPHAVMSLIDAVCDRAEQDWQAGAGPLLEQVLSTAPEEARPELFRQLLRLECDYRRQRGRPLEAEEAWQRFGSLGPWAEEALAAAGLDQTGDRLVLNVVSGPDNGRFFHCDRHQMFLVGRGPGVNLELPRDQALSRLHFVIEFNPPSARLIDRGSRNGTYVNGLKVQQADLRDGDVIQAGQTALQVALAVPVGTETISVATVAPSLPFIPGYTLEAELGRGAMGVVYQASRQADGQRVAVKTVLPAVRPTPVLLGRFKREVEILRRLLHPHIVGFLQAGEASGLLYFVMEYVEGHSLAHEVKKTGPLPPERVTALGCQLLEALAHAHKAGFIHRDVKPHNLLLSQGEKGEVLKVADFGLARAYGESSMSGLTLSNTSGGTPRFMPPEQVEDFHSAGPAADQYAAGATLYYLLTGQHVYEPCGSIVELLNRIVNHDPIPLRATDSGPVLPARLGDVIRRSLARQPDRRYPDVTAMREQLSRAL